MHVWVVSLDVKYFAFCSGILDFARIEATYFAGNTILKAALYGLSHTAMGVGLSIFAVGLLKTLPSTKQIVPKNRFMS